MHVLWKFDREVCTKPTCVRCSWPARRPPQLWRHTGLMRRATRHIDAFLGPSLFTIRMHQERGMRGTMIQLPLFHPEPTPPSDTTRENDGRPYFLFTGRLEKIKGVQVHDPGLPRPARRRSAHRRRRRLRAAAPCHGRRARRTSSFLGRVDHARLQALYRDAVATVVPSLCYETFGLIVAESFSTATPVIVYAQSSLAELVETYGGGLMYRTPEELRAAIAELHARPERRAELGQQGRAAYEAEFAEPAFLTHYLDVVRTLLAQKRAGRPIAATTTEPPLLAGRRVFFAGSSAASAA